jgi:hypothetical protein
MATGAGLERGGCQQLWLREYGSSVVLPRTPANNYDPRGIILGGNNTATTEIIDPEVGTPTWCMDLTCPSPESKWML